LTLKDQVKTSVYLKESEKTAVGQNGAEQTFNAGQEGREEKNSARKVSKEGTLVEF